MLNRVQCNKKTVGNVTLLRKDVRCVNATYTLYTTCWAAEEAYNDIILEIIAQ